MVLKRGLLQILLAVLLLVAQHSALMHQARHLQDRLPAHSQQQDPQQKSTHANLCGFHVSFAEVLGAVGCTAPPLALAANDVESGPDQNSLAVPAEPVLPSSRGPPLPA